MTLGPGDFRMADPWDHELNIVPSGSDSGAGNLPVLEWVVL